MELFKYIKNKFHWINIGCDSDEFFFSKHLQFPQVSFVKSFWRNSMISLIPTKLRCYSALEESI